MAFPPQGPAGLRCPPGRQAALQCRRPGTGSPPPGLGFPRRTVPPMEIAGQARSFTGRGKRSLFLTRGVITVVSQGLRALGTVSWGF